MSRVARYAVTALFAGAVILVPGVASADSVPAGQGTSCVICWPGWN